MKQLVGYIYDQRVSSIPLAIFRILFSILFIVEIWQMFYFRSLVFDHQPFIDKSNVSVTVLLFIWICALFFVLIGFKTRMAAIINYIFCVLILGFSLMNNGHDWHVDSIFIGVSLLLIFMPSDRALSIERVLYCRQQAKLGVRKFPNEKISYMYVVFFILIIGLTYLDSIFYKMSSEMYLSGLGAWAPAVLPFNVFYDVSWLTSSEIFSKSLGYGVLLFELLFIFLIWFKYFRIPLIISGLMLHIGIFLIFPIPIFGILVVILYIPLIPDTVLNKLSSIPKKETNVTVYYDIMCPLCRQTMGIFTALDYRNAVKWKPVQGYADQDKLIKNIPKEKLLRDIYSVSSNGNVFYGVGSYIIILKATGWLYLLGWIMSLWPARQIANKIYNFIAEKRYREGGCTDDTCGVGFTVATLEPQIQSKGIQKFFLGFIFYMWLVSFLIISLASPFNRTYIIGDSKVSYYSEALGSKYKNLVYPWTGWSTHGVFMDNHFLNYTFQTKLVYEGNGNKITLPITTDKGFAGRYNLNRQWVNWTFRSVRPGLSIEELNYNLLRYVNYWAAKNNIDLSSGEILIMQRPLEVSLYKWKSNLLNENINI